MEWFIRITTTGTNRNFLVEDPAWAEDFVIDGLSKLKGMPKLGLIIWQESLSSSARSSHGRDMPSKLFTLVS